MRNTREVHERKREIQIMFYLEKASEEVTSKA